MANITYVCKRCGETYPYQPISCNDCGASFSPMTFTFKEGNQKILFTQTEVDYLLNDVLNNVLILNRQSDLFLHPNSNKIAQFVIDYLKNPKVKS